MARKILLVEDDTAVLEATSEVLLDEGYDVITAPNGREALARVAGGLPDVVLLDLMMPVMNGWQFVQEFRKIEGTELVPLIILSAGRDVAQSAKTLGARDYLIKPFDIDDLLSKVSQVLSAPR